MQTLSTLLGKRIKEIREARKVKQNELANMIDIEPTNLSKIEKGVHLPKDDTINKIIKALNTDISNLFNFEHIQTREALIKSINELLNGSRVEDLQFFYRVMVSYNETKRR